MTTLRRRKDEHDIELLDYKPIVTIPGCHPLCGIFCSTPPPRFVMETETGGGEFRLDHVLE
jgi:hypothetical protein